MPQDCQPWTWALAPATTSQYQRDLWCCRQQSSPCCSQEGGCSSSEETPVPREVAGSPGRRELGLLQLPPPTGPPSCGHWATETSVARQDPNPGCGAARSQPNKIKGPQNTAGQTHSYRNEQIITSPAENSKFVQSIYKTKN